MLLAGNPLIKIEASSLFSIYMGKSVAYGKQNSVLKNFITESPLPLHKLVLFNENCRENEKKKSKQNKALHYINGLKLEVKVRGISYAYCVKPIIFGILSNWL